MKIEVTYRRTRRMSMRIVKNGDVHVSAPLGMPRREVERFIAEHREWLVQARRQQAEAEGRRQSFYAGLPLGTRAERQTAVERLSGVVQPLVERYAELMGVRPRGVEYRAMVSRWGVCRVQRGTLCFSLYLLLLPGWCVEHVVVHELCHLLEPSHGPRFHALMDRYFPRWREARAATRRLMRQG